MWHLLNEDGFVLCNSNLLQMRAEETITIDTTNCPYCRLQWFRDNKSRMPNLPDEGNVLIHWDVRHGIEGVFALCGKIYNDDKYYTCASRNMLDINCNECRRRLIPIAIDRLQRSLYAYGKIIRRRDGV